MIRQKGVAHELMFRLGGVNERSILSNDFPSIFIQYLSFHSFLQLYYGIRKNKMDHVK